MDEKDDQKKAEGEPGAGELAPEKGSALEAYVPGPPVSEPDDVGEVPAVEDDREEPAIGRRLWIRDGAHGQEALDGHRRARRLRGGTADPVDRPAGERGEED